MPLRLPLAKLRRCFPWVVVFCCLTSTLLLIFKYIIAPDDLDLDIESVINITTGRKRHIGFLKVHKAASTTVQFIFLRFGLKLNLTFVLPTWKPPPGTIHGFTNVISTTKSLSPENIAPPPDGKTYDLLCHHVIYNKDAWKPVLPKDMVTVGIVREPLSHFKSILKYFQPPYIINIDSPHPVETFLENPSRFERAAPYSSTNNRMSFEFGVDSAVIQSRDLVRFNKYLHSVLDKEFDMVIVAERMDESLVLMKRKLNWKLQDIIYFRKNVNDIPTPPIFSFRQSYVPLLKAHNELDYLLYDFFNKRLDKQIKEEGDLFLDEVRTFQMLRKDAVSHCRYLPRKKKSLILEATIWNDQFEWTELDCKIFMDHEILLTEFIRRKQYPNLDIPIYGIHEYFPTLRPHPLE